MNFLVLPLEIFLVLFFYSLPCLNVADNLILQVKKKMFLLTIKPDLCVLYGTSAIHFL